MRGAAGWYLAGMAGRASGRRELHWGGGGELLEARCNWFVAGIFQRSMGEGGLCGGAIAWAVQ